MKRIITTIVFGEDLSGSRSVELNLCNALVFKREDETKWKEYTENFKVPAVYVLLNKKSNEAYIGQTDNFQVRLQDHISRKTFWDEAFAFTANNGILGPSETRYLEAVFYEHASAANRYSLTNSQTPQKPPIHHTNRVNAENFLEVVEQLAPFIGCDIFIKKESCRRVSVVAQSRIPQKTDKKSNALSTFEGRIKMSLSVDGEIVGSFNKNHFVHAVIKEYIKKHPSITIAELKERFPKELLGKHWGRWELIEDNLEEARRVASESGNKRHLLKTELILHSGDDVPFVVCSQWDKDNLPNIVKIVEEEGWSYSIIQ